MRYLVNGTREDFKGNLNHFLCFIYTDANVKASYLVQLTLISTSVKFLYAVWNACAHSNKSTNKNYFTTNSLLTVKEENHEILLFDKNRALTNSSLFATGRCLAQHPRWRDRSPVLGPRPQRERPLVALLEAVLAMQ